MTPQLGTSQVEAVRRYGTALTWALWIVAGGALVFTAANVTTFATQHGVDARIAWMLDPLVSLTLGVILLGEGVLARHQRPGRATQGRIKGAGLLKVFAGAATWTMNVWESVDHRDVAGIVLHSVIPALVIGLAELLPRYQARFAEIIVQLRDEPTVEQVRAQAAGELASARAEAAERLTAALEQARVETSQAAAERLTETLQQAETEAAERLTEAVAAARAETSQAAAERLTETLQQAETEAAERLTATLAQARAQAAQELTEAVASARIDEQRQAELRLAQALDQAHRTAREDLQQALADAARHTQETVEQARAEAAERLTEAVAAARAETSQAAAERLTETLQQARAEAAERLTATLAQARAQAAQELTEAVEKVRAETTVAAEQQLADAVARARRAGRREALTAANHAARDTRGPGAQERTGPGRSGRMRLVLTGDDAAGSDELVRSDELVLAALHDAEDGLGPQEICTVTGLPRATVNRSLTRLQGVQDDGADARVTRVRRGVYQAATTPAFEPDVLTADLDPQLDAELDAAMELDLNTDAPEAVLVAP